MHPGTSYIIYATQRSGSSLLCKTLSKTKVAGNPGEFFTFAHAQQYSEWWGVSLGDSNTKRLGEDYIKRMYATATPNGVFGVKLLWSTFSYCLEQIRQLEGNEHLSIPQLLETMFPQHQSVLITRRDKVRQAISWWKAMKTDIWCIQEGHNPKSMVTKRDFDFEEIECLRQQIVDYEQYMKLYFFIFGIEPFTVIYEDFVTSYEETTLRILDCLHIPVPKDLVLGEPLLQKQADEQTEEWVHQYYQIKQEQERVAINKLPAYIGEHSI